MNTNLKKQIVPFVNIVQIVCCCLFISCASSQSAYHSAYYKAYHEHEKKESTELAILKTVNNSVVNDVRTNVKGELRTEINGFQWYNYNNKEAYTIDGNRIIFNDKFWKKKIVAIKFVAIDKKDEGMFLVQTYSRNSKGYYDYVFTREGNRLGDIGFVGRGCIKREKITFPNKRELILINKYSDGKIESLYTSKGKELNKYVSSVYTWNNTIVVETKYDGIWVFDAVGDKLAWGWHKKREIAVDNKQFLLLEANDHGKKYYAVISAEGKSIMRGKPNMTEVVFKHGVIYVKDENDKKGIMSYSGKWIAEPGKYDHVYEYEDGIYIEVVEDGSHFIIDQTGSTIIPKTRNYTSINYDAQKRTFDFRKKGYRGICDRRGKEISMVKLPLSADDIKEKGRYDYASELKNGNTTYFTVRKNNRYGLTDANGKVIIPVEMEDLGAAGNGFLKFKLNGSWGIMNYAGRTIIPSSRGYTSIGSLSTSQKTFAYTMNGYKGECNAQGRELSRVKVKTDVTNDNNNTPQKQEEKKIIIEHHREPQPMQEWVQCHICFGSGVCTIYGCNNGWNSGTRMSCLGCGGSGRCSACAGKGGHYVVVYR